MKKIHSLLALGVLGAMLFTMPVESQAVEEKNSDVLTVTYNNNPSIKNGYYQGTIADDSVLGFYLDWHSAYFCGAISSATSLSIPEKISYEGTEYTVKYCGYGSTLDFDEAQNITSLYLPPTIEDINSLPSTVKVLHLKSYINYVYNNTLLLNLSKVLVPEETLDSFYGNNTWRKHVLINAEGTEPLKITINMTKPGEFAQLLLQHTDNWYKVNELTVIGEMNEDDLNVFKRMDQLTKLDLSQSIISDIPNNFGGRGYSGEEFGILEEVILPSIKKLGSYAFYNTHKLRKVILPHVESIGDYAFEYSNISSIELPEGLSSIGQYAFYQTNLESIKIPSSVTEISANCFQNCYGLKSAVIPESVTKIGYSSFYESGLTSVNLPGVQTISEYAFYNCKELTDVTFAEGLTSLGYYSFRGCTALNEIDLPSTSLSFDSSPFHGCTNIKKVISRAVIPPTQNNNSSIMDGCDMTNVKLYVPAMSIDKYRAESGWKTFYTILPLEDKTSKAYIYNNFTIDDASQFTNDCNFIIDWYSQYMNGQYYCGAVDYNGSTTFSMNEYKQYQHLGESSYNNPYYYGAHFTSLISNGTMRADNVQTTLRTGSNYYWYFISLPYDVKVSDIIYTDGAQFVIRKYSGQNRAEQSGNTWQNLTADDTMHAYEGYILRCNKNEADFTFPAINNSNKNKVFEKENVSVPLSDYPSEFEHNRSWNLIGNPYPCYYDTRYMDFSAPITVWNRYNQRYDAYSPIDDSYILHPAQAFFVQCPVGQASLTFDKTGRQKDETARTLPANAPRRRVSDMASRKVFNVILSDGTNEDHTRFVINDKATCNYDLDKDASKFMSDDNASMLLYTVENGVKYAINERPMAKGIIRLGFYAPTEGDYSLSLNTSQEDNLILIDNETNTETPISGEYHFKAAVGFNDSRFSLMFGEATGISSLDKKDVQINVENGIVSANTSYNIYTIDGQLMGSYNAGNTTILSKGIYVIQSKDVKRKIVVK